MDTCTVVCKTLTSDNKSQKLFEENVPLIYLRKSNFLKDLLEMTNDGTIYLPEDNIYNKQCFDITMKYLKYISENNLLDVNDDDDDDEDDPVEVYEDLHTDVKSMLKDIDDLTLHRLFLISDYLDVKIFTKDLAKEFRDRISKMKDVTPQTLQNFFEMDCSVKH